MAKRQDIVSRGDSFDDSDCTNPWRWKWCDKTVNERRLGELIRKLKKKGHSWCSLCDKESQFFSRKSSHFGLKAADRRVSRHRSQWNVQPPEFYSALIGSLSKRTSLLAMEEEEEHEETCWEKYAPKLIREKLFSGRRPPRNRKVYVDNKPLPGEDSVVHYSYPNNRVVSSKYTFVTFLPKNLFEQFRRVANFYFLCVALTQFMIDTPVTPITSVLPLLFVISITAIKQGYEDYLRHKADSDVNNRPAVIIRKGEVQRGLRAMDVQVGDIVKTYINEEFPCDMVLLSSEDPKGHCFITTANLDGETNLKTHFSQLETRRLQTPQALGTLRASITCRPQTADLYTFQGVMHFGPDADPQPLGPDHLLLRGARLKNTPWVYGCAIYTGKETKMALNSNAKKAKFSRVERKLNTFLILFLVVLVMGCVVPTAFKYWFEHREGDDPWYFYEEGKDDKDASSVLETGLSFMVLINYIIPISLYVTIELQKFLGSLFFNYDVEMYDSELNEPAMANTSDLNEELGQVEYLFTDKTGTLTENNMTFRKCIIGKRLFEEVDGTLCERIGDNFVPVTDRPPPSSKPSQESSMEMNDFLRVLVLCHTVRVDRQSKIRSSADSDNLNHNSNFHLRWKWPRKKQHDSVDSLGSYYDQQEEADSIPQDASPKLIANNRNSNSSIISDTSYSVTGQEYEYQASSPDEKAFVEACSKYGTIYHGLNDDIHEVTIQKELHRFKLLETLPFDAVRKRMSVIIRDAEGDITLLCKGAEVAIFDRVIHGDVEATQRSIDEYALSGYRTLCLARRKLTVEEYEDLSNKLAAARLSLVDREAKLAEVYSECEKDLTLLGATAVEDKLQEGVPETITALRNAGIKVWVLTGDKEETAVNISHSAGHFYPGMTELRLTNVSSSEQCHEQLLVMLNQVKKQGKESQVQYSLVVDGKSLAYALKHDSESLRKLCTYCAAVLCCRMSPIQKAEVVYLVKSSPDQPVTAAIGDGANDVSMIQEADVGFGIMGKEGRQAVCNSDYAFGKFRFLRRALLLHGHYYYHRLAVLVKYFFYKNVAWVTCQIYFAIFSYWSQQSFYDPFFLTFYNMTSTSLPILIYGIFEQVKPKDKLMCKPHLYKSITRNAALGWRVFGEWLILAVWHSLVFFFCVYFMEIDNTSHFSSGYSIGVYDFGTLVAIAGIVAVNAKLMLETYYWCWPLVFSYCFAAVGSLTMAILYTALFMPNWLATTRDLYGVPGQLYSSLNVWLGLLITVVAALLPDYVLRTLRDNREALQERREEEKSSWNKIGRGYLSQSTILSQGHTGAPRLSTRVSSSSIHNSEHREDDFRKKLSSVAHGQAEMTKQSCPTKLPGPHSDIELQEVRQRHNYGTIYQIEGEPTNQTRPESENIRNLSSLPNVLTLQPGQGLHQPYHQINSSPQRNGNPQGNNPSIPSLDTTVHSNSLDPEEYRYNKTSGNSSEQAQTSNLPPLYPADSSFNFKETRNLTTASSSSLPSSPSSVSYQDQLNDTQQALPSSNGQILQHSSQPSPLYDATSPKLTSDSQIPNITSKGPPSPNVNDISTRGQDYEGQGFDNPVFSLASEETRPQSKESETNPNLNKIEFIIRL